MCVAPPPTNASFSFSGSPSYAPVGGVFPAGTLMTVQVCNHGSAAGTAFVQSHTFVTLGFGQSDDCNLFARPPDQIGFFGGDCNGNPIGAGEPTFAPSIAPGACQTYAFDTFFVGNGNYDWVLSINGSSSGTVHTVHDCNDLQQSPLCVRSL
jgi:hypothetical protein